MPRQGRLIPGCFAKECRSAFSQDGCDCQRGQDRQRDDEHRVGEHFGESEVEAGGVGAVAVGDPPGQRQRGAHPCHRRLDRIEPEIENPAVVAGVPSSTALSDRDSGRDEDRSETGPQRNPPADCCETQRCAWLHPRGHGAGGQKGSCDEGGQIRELVECRSSCAEGRHGDVLVPGDPSSRHVSVAARGERRRQHDRHSTDGPVRRLHQSPSESVRHQHGCERERVEADERSTCRCMRGALQRFDSPERKHGDKTHHGHTHRTQSSVRRQAEGVASFDCETVHHKLDEAADGGEAALVEVVAGEAPGPSCSLERVGAGCAGVEVDAEPVSGLQCESGQRQDDEHRRPHRTQPPATALRRVGFGSRRWAGMARGHQPRSGTLCNTATGPGTSGVCARFPPRAGGRTR